MRLAAVLAILGATQTRAQELKLIPKPRQVEKHSGQFAITSGTRIIVNRAHAAEDRVGAEMLAEDIQLLGGQKAKIENGGLGGATAIYLVRLDDAGARKALAAAGLSADDKFDPEGYLLLAEPKRVIVAGQSGSGLFYGVQTLRQMLMPDGKGLACPAAAVKDWPAMRWRGMHDDISRGPIPTLDYMKRQIRTLAEYKMNLYSMYMEAVFDYSANPLIGPKEAALTPDKVRELVKYAAQYHITIVPEQEAFGHLHHILKNEVYNDLAETPHGHVLAPVNPKSFALIKSMFDELVPLFPGPFLHIGADETFELGRGQTKARADQEGIGKVYLEFLQKIAEIMQPYHKRLMLWGDIAVHYPQLLNILPKDVVAVAWAYSPRDNFDSELKPYKDAGLDLFVSPGANNWNVIFPNLDRAYVNVRNFVRDGQKFGALGMLNTTWDDDGEALFGMTWPPLVLGAACSWQPGECSIEDFENSYDWAFYRNRDNSFRDALRDLNHTHGLLKSAGLGDADDNAFWLDPFSEQGAAYVRRALPVARELRLSAEHALELLYRNRANARLHSDTIDPLIMAANRLDLLGMKVQFAAEISGYYWDAFRNQGDSQRVRRDLQEITATNARLEDLRDATTRVRGMYSDAWLKENYPYWLGNVLVRYDNLAGMYENKIWQVKNANWQFSAKGFLPDPQQMGFFQIEAPVK